MSNLIINKGSGKYTILSLGIALFLVMFFLTFVFLKDTSNVGNNIETVILVELENQHPSNITEIIESELTQIEGIDKIEIEFIDSKNAPSFFNKEIQKVLLNQNAFKNILKGTFFNKLTVQQKQSVSMVASKLGKHISGISLHENMSSSKTIQFNYAIISLPFLIICLGFCSIIIAGTIKSDLSLNQLEVKRSILAGMDPKVLYSGMYKQSFEYFSKSIVIAIILYISTFYLICHFLKLNFSELSVYIYLKPIFTSILIIAIGLYLITKFKVSRFLKSI